MDNARKFLLKNVPAGAPLTVAFSGGGDSAALLRFCVEFTGGKNLFALHVNHGIRGKNAARDEAFVRAECEKAGVPLTVINKDVPAFARKYGLTIEEAGREARYAAFKRAHAETGGYILLAHHAGDRAETVLFNVLRGSTAAGAAGMPEIREGYILRPFLRTPKTAILKYLAENGVAFINDETNSQLKHTRNFLRLKVMPLLNGRFEAERALNSLADSAAADEEYLRSVAIKPQMLPDGVWLPADVFGQHPALKTRSAAAALKAAGAKDVTRARINALCGAWEAGAGSRAHLGAGITAAHEYGGVRLFTESAKGAEADGKTEPPPVPFNALRGGGAAEFGQYMICAEKISGSAAREAVRKTSAPPDYSCRADILSRALYINAAAVPESACFRARKTGDVIALLSGGRRTLKEYLIDKKVPAALRAGLPVLAEGSAVYMVAGVEIARDVRLTEGTEMGVKIWVEEKYDE